MRMVLLSGKQGSGKTTIQKALTKRWVDLRNEPAVEVNFASVLYEMHDAVLNVLHKYWPNRNLKKDGPLLQLLGTQWGRETIDTDIWVKCLKAKIQGWQRAHSAENALIIVGDCRFENEFDVFPEALRVRLYCPEEVRKTRCEMWRDDVKHASETGLDLYYTQDKFDLVLHTEHTDVADCVDKIIFTLQSNKWQRTRK